MKTIKIIVFSFFLSHSSMAQFGGESSKQVFKSPSFKDSIAAHKTVAILPFKASIAYKRMPKGFDLEGNKMEEKKLGISMQQGMYTYLLKQREKYTVMFQDVERTNILLKQAAVFEKLDEILPDSIAKLLKVDAVISCSYAYEKTGSEGGAIAKAVLIGIPGKTGSGALTMQVYNKSDGELLWRFYKEMNETITSNGNEVMERMMRKVSRNFPYEK